MNIQKRKLGGLESLFYTWDQSDPKHFLVAAEVHGYTTAENWKHGLALLQLRHPMLNVGITASDGDLVFFPTTEREIPFEIKHVKTKIDIKLELEKELGLRIDTAQGPLARVKLFQNSDKCLVIFSIHHAISDGLSVVFLLNDLLRSVTGTGLGDLPEASSMDDILNLKITNPAVKITDQIKPEFLEKYNYIKDEPKPEIDILTFSEEFTTKLIRRAKEEETTVHGTLQAAAIEAIAYFSEQERNEVSIMSPISPRAHLGVTENCGLYTMASTVNFNITEKLPFWELSRHAKQELATSASLSALENYTTQTNNLVANVNDLTGFMEANLNIDIMLSNLGRYPFGSAYGPLTVTGIYGPMIISGSGKKQSIGAITVNGKLALTHSSRYLIPGFLAFLHSRLTKACDQTT
jgi:NRPS condensation-like uncharacterized protein